MQRLHDDDLAGALMRKSSQTWNLLKLPAIAEEEERIQIGVDRFHTRRVGDALDPERAPLSFLESRRAELDAHIFAAQYQQDPIPPGGDIIKPEWIQRCDAPPERDSSCQMIQSWDPASRVGEQNDWSACSTWLHKDGKYYLIHMLRGRHDFPTLKQLVISHARVYKPDTILIEEDMIGKALIDELNRQPRTEYSVIGIKPEHNKRTRMLIQSSKFESGQVFFPNEASWLKELENELFSFPHGRHDDQVDSIGQALAYKISSYNLYDAFERIEYRNIFDHYGFRR